MLDILAAKVPIFNMLALSTSWISSESTNAETLLEALSGFDIAGIELSYRISEAMFRQMKKPLKRSGLKVVSVHNFFPIPSAKPDSKGSGDLFLLSSPDKKERQRAVQWTIKSIEHAHELSAAAVVLHCGYVQMNHEMPILYQYLKSNRIHSPEAQAFIKQKLKERDHFKPKHLDCLLSSLDNLVRVAEKQNILLGLENRYYYHELPGLADFRVIFNKLSGSPLGYWHDTGHAHAHETLTLIPKEALLKANADRLIGVHLHDATGIIDHLAPGTGQIDFNRLLPYLNRDTIKVIELQPGIPSPEVSRGIRFIREKISIQDKIHLRSKGRT